MIRLALAFTVSMIALGIEGRGALTIGEAIVLVWVSAATLSVLDWLCLPWPRFWAWLATFAARRVSR